MESNVNILVGLRSLGYGCVKIWHIRNNHGQRSICRKIVVYVVHSSTSRAIAHALWRLLSNDLNDTLLTGMLNAARLTCFAHYNI